MRIDPKFLSSIYKKWVRSAKSSRYANAHGQSTTRRIDFRWPYLRELLKATLEEGEK